MGPGTEMGAGMGTPPEPPGGGGRTPVLGPGTGMGAGTGAEATAGEEDSAEKLGALWVLERAAGGRGRARGGPGTGMGTGAAEGAVMGFWGVSSGDDEAAGPVPVPRPLPRPLPPLNEAAPASPSIS